MFRDVDDLPLLAIRQIVPNVAQAIQLLAPQHLPHLVVVIPLLQVLALLRILVAKVDDIIGCSAFIGVTDFILLCHVLNAPALALFFVLHILPPLEVALVLLNSKGSN